VHLSVLALVAKSTSALRSPTPAAPQPLQVSDALLMLPLQTSYRQESLKGVSPTGALPRAWLNLLKP
jgi:hypothetical protein